MQAFISKVQNETFAIACLVLEAKSAFRMWNFRFGYHSSRARDRSGSREKGTGPHGYAAVLCGRKPGGRRGLAEPPSIAQSRSEDFDVG
jgi:hypothetical protein